MLSASFLVEFKRATEARWAVQAPILRSMDFQIQRGARWNPGLSDEQLKQYEAVVGFRFPPDVRELLREMNGTDLPTLDVYGKSGEPARESVGVCAFPAT
jgi:hypothetical protein